VLQRYATLLDRGSFEQLDDELFEGTWAPTPGLLLPDELSAIGHLIVEFELAVANRDATRAALALEGAWGWVRRRGPS
jgi:hypothetical protein